MVSQSKERTANWNNKPQEKGKERDIMEKSMLTEQQERTLKKLGEALPNMSMMEKMMLLARYEGYNEAREVANKKADTPAEKEE